MNGVRQAERQDADEVAAVVASAFGEAHHGWVLEACRITPEEWLVLQHDGEVVSTCRAFMQRLRVGKCEINKADVGWVATRADLQGRGFGSVLMEGLNEHLPQRGCQLGRLGGLIRFYSRFGWVPFPRRTVEFILQPAKAGTQVMRPQEYLLPPPDFRARVVPYHSRKHYRARTRLYDEMNRERSGSVVVAWADEPPREPRDETGLKVVCQEAGEVLGYLFAFERDDPGPFDPKVEIGEFAYDMRRPEALWLMLVHVLATAAARGADRVVGRMPFDPRIERAMVAAGVWFQWVELHSAPASNMVRVLDLVELLGRICPELEARLAVSPLSDWRGEIAFCLPNGESAVLEIGDGSVAAWAWAPGKIRVDLDEATMVALLFGIQGFWECAEVADEEGSPAPRGVCEALFPRCPTASGAWG